MINKIIANPPYGKSSSLSKKIVNTLLENKVAEEMVVLAPPTTFKDFVPYVDSFSEELSTSMFDTVGIASGIPIKVVKLLKEPVNKFSDYAEIVLSDKELALSKVVKDYNSSHKLPYIDYFSCTLKNKKEVQNAFLISFWSGLCQVSGKVRLGEMWEHNGQGKDIPWRDSSAPYALVFETNNEFCNFRDWWYKTSNEEVKTTPFKQFLFSTILHRYGGTPALKCYLEYLPNLDWSKPHTDAEILAELGLPEDFLEKEENENNKL